MGKHDKFSKNEINYITGLRKQGYTWQKTAFNFNIRFNKNKSDDALRFALSRAAKSADKPFVPQVVPSAKNFKKIPPKLEGFHRHHTSLVKMFKAAGLKDGDVLRVVVQPDSHVPEHDKDAMAVFCKFLNYYKPHALVNLGDFLEMESVAHWPATSHPGSRRLVPEIKVGKEVLQQINDAAGKQLKHRWMLEGNHEYWLQMYLNERIPEVADQLEDLGVKLDLPTLLSLDKFGYTALPVNEILSIGNANFTHGYYTCSNHAAKHLSVFGCNIYYGHLHDVQSHSGVSVRGVHEAMSLGCLRTLNAKFLKGKPSNWSHAFGVFEFRLDGSYTRYVPIIVDGVMSFNGKVFRA